MRSLWQDRGHFSPATIRLKYEKKHIFVPSHYDDNCRQFDRSIHCAHAEHVNKILTIAGNQWEQKCNFLFCLFILSHVMQFEGNHYPQCNSIRNFYSRFCITILLWRNKQMRWWECTRISAMKWKENWIASITIVVLWSWSNVYHSAIAPHMHSEWLCHTQRMSMRKYHFLFRLPKPRLRNASLLKIERNGDEIQVVGSECFLRSLLFYCSLFGGYRRHRRRYLEMGRMWNIYLLFVEIALHFSLIYPQNNNPPTIHAHTQSQAMTTELIWRTKWPLLLFRVCLLDATNAPNSSQRLH